MGSWFSSILKLNCCAGDKEDSKLEINPEKARQRSKLTDQSHIEEVPEMPKATPTAQPAESHSSTARSSLIAHFDFDLADILNEQELTEKLEGSEHLYGFGGRYVGDVVALQRHGFGTMQWSETVSYEGYWDRGMPTGEGTMTIDGHIFQGIWSDENAEGSAEVLEARLEGLEDWLQAYNEGYCKD